MEQCRHKCFWREDFAADGGPVRDVDVVRRGTIVAVLFEHGAAVVFFVILASTRDFELWRVYVCHGRQFSKERVAERLPVIFGCASENLRRQMFRAVRRGEGNGGDGVASAVVGLFGISEHDGSISHVRTTPVRVFLRGGNSLTAVVRAICNQQSAIKKRPSPC